MTGKQESQHVHTHMGGWKWVAMETVFQNGHTNFSQKSRHNRHLHKKSLPSNLYQNRRHPRLQEKKEKGLRKPHAAKVNSVAWFGRKNGKRQREIARVDTRQTSTMEPGTELKRAEE